MIGIGLILQLGFIPLTPPVGATGGEVRLSRVDRGEEGKIESPPKLGIINITPFMERLIYYQSTCPEFRYGDGKVLGIQPHRTRESASTHCVLCFNLIKDTFNIHHSRLTYTLAHI